MLYDVDFSQRKANKQSRFLLKDADADVARCGEGALMNSCGPKPSAILFADG